MAYQREYCCSNCGLIWFENYIVECPECHHNTGIYACDTMGYAYMAKAIEEILKARNKAIHYAKGHPYYKE